ncbi:hypothetical protein ACF1G5_35630 [Streptomyces coeruleorubidus]|uniref:hypothetical protein n=1 Tax=Streptomyces coeruleorubidus TaxID=116188 RepID=UPI0036F848B5
MWRLLIPYLRVDAPATTPGLDREHRLTAPPVDDPKLVCWHKQGASPGERGTTVAVGRRQGRVVREGALSQPEVYGDRAAPSCA